MKLFYLGMDFKLKCRNKYPFTLMRAAEHFWKLSNPFKFSRADLGDQLYVIAKTFPELYWTLDTGKLDCLVKIIIHIFQYLNPS